MRKDTSIEQIEKEIEIDYDNFEPADTQGYSMEGFVVYNNKEYPVYLSHHELQNKGKSFVHQAAEQIAGALDE